MSLYRYLPVDALAQVNFLTLQSFAISRGWYREPNGTRHAVFKARHSEDAIVIPLSRGFTDYAELIGDAIHTLSRYEEDRTPRQLLSDLLLPPSDVLRFRLEDPDAASGTLPLFEGINLIDGGRRTILASAHTVISPRTFYAQLSLSSADAFVRQCRLGQTEIGSYIATFVCPIGAEPVGEPAQASLDIPIQEAMTVEPFARTVTRMVMQTVGHIADAIRDGDARRLVKPSPDDLAAKKPIVSSNLCEALIAMKPRGRDSNLTVTSSWSATRPIPADVPSLVHLPADFFPTIEAVAMELHPKLEPRRDTYVGKVFRLDRPDDEAGSGTVWISILASDGAVSAAVKLNPIEYDVAVDAHKFKAYVQVEGLLARGPRSNRLEEHTGFRRI